MFFGYLTSAFLIVGLQKEDYLLFIFISYAFIIGIYLYVKYIDFGKYLEEISNDYCLEQYSQCKNGYHEWKSASWPVIISMIILILIYLSSALTLDFSLSSAEKEDIVICGSLPQLKSINLNVKMNSIYCNFMSPAIILDNEIVQGVNVKFSHKILNPSLNSLQNSSMIINITDDVNFTNSTININASWYVFGIPIDMHQYKTFNLKVPPMINLSPDIPYKAMAGSSVNWSANVPCNRSLNYSFYKNGILFQNENGTPDNMRRWRTNLSDIGNNIIEVFVEDKENSSWNRSAKYVYKIFDNLPPFVTLERTLDTNNFDAYGKDPEGDPLEYKFEIIKNNKLIICDKCDYWSVNRHIVANLGPGFYKMIVYVRDPLHNWTNCTNRISFNIKGTESKKSESDEPSDEQPPDSSNLQSESDEQPQDSSNLQSESDEQPQDSSNLQSESDEQPQDSSNLQSESDEQPQDSLNAPPNTIDRANALIGAVKSKIL
jgi:hypothetical protein